MIRKIPYPFALFFFLIFFTLSACTTFAPTPPKTIFSFKDRTKTLQQIKYFQLSGKIAVQTNKEAGSAVLHWTQNNGQYEMALLNPLGTSILKLTGKKESVLLETADGKSYSAKNPEQLLADQWGFHLPVSYLNYWVRGIPVPGLPYHGQFDVFHRLKTLSQQNIQIQFLSYMNTELIDLPQMITITSPTLKAKIRIYQWTLN